MVPTPYAKMHTVTVNVSSLRQHRCEKCKGYFAYALKRKVKGAVMTSLIGNSQKAAATAAEHAQLNAADALKEFDSVYCPNCGWMQERMIVQLKKKYLKWMDWAGGWAVGLGILILFVGLTALLPNSSRSDKPNLPAPIFLGIGGILLASGIAMILIRKSIIKRLAPNALPVEKRLEKARAVAFDEKKIREIKAQAQGASQSG